MDNGFFSLVLRKLKFSLSLRLANKMFNNPLNLLEQWDCICSVLHVLDSKNGGLELD